MCLLKSYLLKSVFLIIYLKNNCDESKPTDSANTTASGRRRRFINISSLSSFLKRLLGRTSKKSAPSYKKLDKLRSRSFDNVMMNKCAQLATNASLVGDIKTGVNQVSSTKQSTLISDTVSSTSLLTLVLVVDPSI